MPMLNTTTEYGALNKFLHWAIVAIFAFQYVVANIMLSLGPKETALGLTQGNYYNWHKSIGLIALGFAIFRLLARSFAGLPDWAASLSEREKSLIHIYEKLLYAAMLIMPVSGFIYVMAGGYGVHFLEVTHLPNPIGKNETIAFVAKWTHIISAYVIVVALLAHLGVVFRQQFILGSGLLYRMLPGRRSDG